MKVEAYVSLQSGYQEEPFFSLRISNGDVSFEIDEMAEHEIRHLADDIVDMLEMNIRVVERFQGLASSPKEEAK